MAQDKFAVVEFEDGLLVVPNKWIVAERNECYYPPPTSTRIESAVRNKEDPLPSWHKYPIKRIFATSSDYYKCNKKLDKAKYQSDGFSSTDVDISEKIPSEIMPFPEPPSSAVSTLEIQDQTTPST